MTKQLACEEWEAEIGRHLRALGRADWLDTLAPAVSISPLQLLKSSAPRRRVSR